MTTMIDMTQHCIFLRVDILLSLGELSRYTGVGTWRSGADLGLYDKAVDLSVGCLFIFNSVLL